ncbi:MAG: aminotransferase class I/II-fold pyridoxal phosphate-dependent enzyme [Propionibacteriaceae bacterium]|jgi:aspartate/methionine/tyrosine aminotransferase|nr:aminotransferase class I/II-fold pyridoxal phosphate-dependent enzyme [Propionibacteriaceae bacterium]
MENAIALKRAEIEAAGIELTDLTDTNPTRHNLLDPAVLEIIAEHLPGASRYEPHPRGPWPARAALAERYGGDPEDYWLCASTSEAYGWLFSLLAGAGKAVAVPSPGYPLIEPLAQYRGVSTRDYRSFYAHPSGWELDRTSLEQTLAEPDVRAVVAIHPNNPTGAYQDPIIAQLAHKQGLPLIADEVFFPYQFEDPLSTDIKR